MKFRIFGALHAALAAAFLFALTHTASAQSQIPNTAIMTLSAQGAGTVTSNQYSLPFNPSTGVAPAALACVYTQSAHGGTPSVTFSIAEYDPGTNTYIPMVTSGAITTDATPTMIELSPQVQGTAPSNVTEAQERPPSLFRVSVTVAGSGTPTSTATVGCHFKH